MPHFTKRRLVIPSLSLLAAASLAMQADPHYPVLVTDLTRKDATAFTALLRPGRVIFMDSFESKASFSSYFEVQGLKEGWARIDSAKGSPFKGSGCLSLVAQNRGGASSGASVHYSLPNKAGEEKVHLRAYMRFADNYDQGNLNHTGISLSGHSGDNKWAAMGKAGLKPNGDDRLSSRIEPWIDYRKEKPPGYFFCYSYWMDMKRDRDGNFWGNMLGPLPAERIVPTRGKWICLELMIKLNTFRGGSPQPDGELAAWVDGKLYEHYRGFRWRSSPEVTLKNFALDVYVHEARQANQVWFDEAVVSTGYIGPEP
jgi:hypothetical protein